MKFKLFLLTLLICSSSFGQSLPELRHADKIRIKEAMAISTEFGDKLFQGYSTVPFAIILVTDSTEFLINHPNPSSDFKLLGTDYILKTNIYYRKTQFSPHILATFPAVNGLSCSVVGTPENTNTNSTEWVIYLLHEHFHQYQMTDPEYFKSVDDLDLSGGDQTGKWMLNYPFPYDSLPVMEQYELYTKALYKAVTQGNKSNLKKYFAERRKLRKILSDTDYRYLSFQIWQEGLAKYTEYNFLELLENYSPSKEMVALPDFISFPEYKSKMYQNEIENLLQNKLDETKRVCFYSVGFAEGILLDKLSKSWREKYLIDKFYIEHYSKKYD
ncbi:hypothetical protein [Negadavirga shengliensis]|uniref:Zinc-binding metallo-peptidase n=1 Tax=Negadavirga shengliensis TaxID=1389218 RepID=A0ABV9T6M5_9BACT